MISLIGFPGAGKSSLGQQLAKEWSIDFIDTDTLLEERYGHPCRELWQRLGERRFRVAERELVLEIEPGAKVVATGGGVGLCPICMGHLQAMGEVVYVKVDYPMLLKRLRRRGMPAWATEEGLHKSYEERTLLYERHADTIWP